MSAEPPQEQPTKRASSRWFRARNEVLWLFLIALAVRAAAAFVNPAILPDSVALLRGVARVDEGGLGAALAGPDHPLFAWIAALRPASLDPETFATAISVTAGAFAVWPLHVLARRASGRHAATAASIVYAALPKAVGVASVPLTSALLLPLFLSALSLAATAAVPGSTRRRYVRLVSAGLTAGLAYLARPEGALAAAGAVLLAAGLARKGRRLASAAVVAAAFALVALPYAAALSSGTGRLVVSPKKDIARFVGSEDAPLDGAAAAGVGSDVASAIEGALTTPIVLLVLAGAFLPGRWRHPRSALARAGLLAVAAVHLAACIRLAGGWGYVGARHVLPGMLLLLPFAGEGFLFLGVFISRVIARRRLAVVLAAFLAIPCVVRCLLRPEGADGASRRALGERIAEASREGSGELTIASFKEPLVAYYAGRALAPSGRTARDVPLWGRHRALLGDAPPPAADGELTERLRTEGVRWLVVDVFAPPPSGEAVRPGLLLARRLRDAGVLTLPAVAAGSELAAFPLR